MFEALYSYHNPPGGPSVSPFQEVALLGQVYRPPPEVEKLKEERAAQQSEKNTRTSAGDDVVSKQELCVAAELNSGEKSTKGPASAAVALASSAVDEISVSLPEQIRNRYYSIIWFTYRSKFPRIMPTSLTSDAGWGCLIRSGQMMLAQALLRHETNDQVEFVDEKIIRKVLLLFADSTEQQVIFSLHNIAKMGSLLGCPIGKWFGPLILSFSVKKIVSLSGRPENFTVCVAQDSQIDDKELLHFSDQKKSILLFVPLRLGLNSIHSAYLPSLSDIFSWPSSVGAIGGASQAARFFVGIQKDRVLMLDPHTTQKAVDMSNPDQFDLSSYRCLGTETMPVAKINPSLALGFFFSSRNAVDQFLIKVYAQSKEEFPLFSITDGEVHHESSKSLDEITSGELSHLKGKEKKKSKKSSKSSSLESSSAASAKELEIDDFVEL